MALPKFFRIRYSLWMQWNVPQGSVKVTAGQGSSYWERGLYCGLYFGSCRKSSTMESWKSNTPIKNFSRKQFICLIFRLKQWWAVVLIMSSTKIFKSVEQSFICLVHWRKSQYRWWTNFQHDLGSRWNLSYNSRFLTKLLDKLPLYNTRETSSLTFSGEFPNLFLVTPKAVGKTVLPTLMILKRITPLDMKIREAGSPSVYHWKLKQNVSGRTVCEQSCLWIQPFPYRVVLLVILSSREINRASPSDIDANDHNFVREVPQAEIFQNKSSRTVAKHHLYERRFLSGRTRTITTMFSPYTSIQTVFDFRRCRYQRQTQNPSSRWEESA